MNTITISADKPIKIPPAWQKQFGVSKFELKLNKRSISILPKKAEQIDCWDAERDNGGKSIPTSKMIATLEKIKREKNGQK